MWANTHKDWTADDWGRVLWSDESRFELNTSDSRKSVIRKPEEAFQQSCIRTTVKFPASVMVWGFMSGEGVGSLYFIEGTVNAAKYREILETSLMPTLRRLKSRRKRFIFQQDGATCHTAKSSKEWMAKKNIPLLPWAPSSPDMSPIETLWGVMKKKLREKPVKTIKELRDNLQLIWDGFTPEFCKSLVDTMPQRVSDLLSNKGGVTKW